MALALSLAKAVYLMRSMVAVKIDLVVAVAMVVVTAAALSHSTSVCQNHPASPLLG